jgi:hypothetical protein
MTFTESQEYIRQLAAKHRAPDSDHEELELTAFRAILRFALTEGFEADAQVVNNALHGADDGDKDDDHTTWDYMYLLLDVFDARLATNRLLPKTAELYQFWKTAFWPASADD